MEFPELSELLSHYTVAVGHSKPARSAFLRITKKPLKTKGSSIRWWVENDVVESCIYPFLENGKLLEWVEELRRLELCPQTSKKLHAILTAPAKFALVWLQALVATKGCKQMKASFTVLEGLGWEYITGYPELLKVQGSLKSWKTEPIIAEVRRIAARAPGAGPVPVVDAPEVIDHVDARAKALLNASINNSGDAGIQCSISCDYGNWDGEPPATRYQGIIKRWANKLEKKLHILWEGNNQCRAEEEDFL